MVKSNVASAAEDQIASLTEEMLRLRTSTREAKEAMAAAEKRAKESEMEFVDLKVRLLSAEKANEFMRGYLARVQEDDVVNEELVAIGEPGGEQQMVPKRKPASFPRPSDFTEPRTDTMFDYVNHSNRKAKHWITY